MSMSRRAFSTAASTVGRAAAAKPNFAAAQQAKLNVANTILNMPSAASTAANILNEVKAAQASSPSSTTISSFSNSFSSPSSSSSSFTSPASSSSTGMLRRVVATFQLRCHDRPTLHMIAKRFVDTVASIGATVRPIIPMPTHLYRLTLLRSPHVDKHSRQQFEIRTHRCTVKAVLPAIVHDHVNLVVTRLASSVPIAAYASAKTSTYLLPRTWQPSSMEIQQALQQKVTDELKQELLDTFHRSRTKSASRKVEQMIAYHVREQTRLIDTLSNRATFSRVADEDENELARAHYYQSCVAAGSIELSPHVLLHDRDNQHGTLADISDSNRFARDYIFDLKSKGFSEQQLQTIYGAAGKGELADLVLGWHKLKRKKLVDTGVDPRASDVDSGGTLRLLDEEDSNSTSVKEEVLHALFTPEQGVAPHFADNPEVARQWDTLKQQAANQLRLDGLSEHLIRRALEDMEKDLQAKVEGAATTTAQLSSNSTRSPAQAPR